MIWIGIFIGVFIGIAVMCLFQAGNKQPNGPNMQAMCEALDACRADCKALEEQLATERRSKAQLSGENLRLLAKLRNVNFHKPILAGKE